MKNVIAMSTICADVFDRTGEVRLGGEALNFAMNILGYSNIKIGLLGAIGDDEIGIQAINCITEKGIDKSCVHIIEGGATATNKIYQNIDGDRYFKEDSWNGGVYQTFQLSRTDMEKLQKTDIVFINYYSPNFKRIVELKSMCGYKMAVDFDVMRNFEELEKIIDKIEFVFFSGDAKMLSTLREWSKKYEGIFNATLAENGSVTYYNGIEYRCKAVDIEKIVDTTGCGDSYHAAFLASYLEKKDIMYAMEQGSAQAAKTLTHIGGF